MDCPACPHVPLEEKEYSAGVLLDFCPQCDGAWLDPGELESLGAGLEEFAYLLENGLKAALPAQIACPHCSEKMGRVRIERADAEMLSCPKCHGTWVSHKQLRTLHDFIRNKTQPQAPPEPPPPPPRPLLEGSLPLSLLPDVPWTVALTAAGMGAYFLVIYMLIQHPPKAVWKLPPRPVESVAHVEAPAAPPPPAAQPGPSEIEVQTMIQTAVKRALTPPKRAEIHSDVDSPTYSSPVSDSRVALVVGIEQYAEMPAARYSVRDAVAVRDHLLAMGYPPRNVLLLTDEGATKGRLAAALNTWLPKHAQEGSTVFFYYSGHGAPDPASRLAYLVPVDGEAEDLPSTALSLKHVCDRLNALKAKSVIVALDSCFSGLGGRSVLPKGARPLVTQVNPTSGITGKMTILSASGPDQISGTLDEEGHGAFTYFLLKGLNSDAEDAQGRVTLSSLFRYLKPRVEDAARLQKRDQTPQMTASGDLSLVLREPGD